MVDNLGEARSNKMSKNGNDIFVGEFNVSDDKCDGSDRSEYRVLIPRRARKDIKRLPNVCKRFE